MFLAGFARAPAEIILPPVWRGLCARGDRVCEAGKLGLEAEVFADAATVKERIEGARTLSVRAVGRRSPHGREQRGELGRFVVDHVVDAMRRRGRIEQASDGSLDGTYTCVPSPSSVGQLTYDEPGVFSTTVASCNITVTLTPMGDAGMTVSGTFSAVLNVTGGGTKTLSDGTFTMSVVEDG